MLGSAAAPPSTPASRQAPADPKRRETGPTHPTSTPSSFSTPSVTTFAKPSAKKPSTSSTPHAPETPAPIRAIRQYTSDSEEDDKDESDLVTPKPNHPSSYTLHTPRDTNQKNHAKNDQLFGGEEEEQELEEELEDDDDGAFDDQDPDDLTMPVFPMHRKANVTTPNQSESTPTSSAQPAAVGKPAGLPKHMLARKQAGYSSPTDKILSPVSSKLSRSSVPKSKPAIGDLSPLFAKAKITDQKQQQLTETPTASTPSTQRPHLSRLGSSESADQ